jgi:hypothetical protein
VQSEGLGHLHLTFTLQKSLLTQEKHTQDDGTGVPEHTVRITEQLLLLRGVL